MSVTWLLNIVFPGAGLIIWRREWLGVCLVVLFGVSGNMAIAGWLIAPDSIPPGVRWGAVALAAAVWALAQWLMARQKRVWRRQSAAIDLLIREARLSVESGNAQAAEAAIRSGLALDDENAELRDLAERICPSRRTPGRIP